MSAPTGRRYRVHVSPAVLARRSEEALSSAVASGSLTRRRDDLMPFAYEYLTSAVLSESHMYTNAQLAGIAKGLDRAIAKLTGV